MTLSRLIVVILMLRITLQLPFQNSHSKQIYSMHAVKQVLLFLLLFLDYMTDPQWGNTFIITFDIFQYWLRHLVFSLPDSYSWWYSLLTCLSTFIDSVSRNCWGSVFKHHLDPLFRPTFHLCCKIYIMDPFGLELKIVCPISLTKKYIMDPYARY